MKFTKAISKHYVRICTPKYHSLGFYRYKTTFARINGDLIQVFTLKCSQYMPECTVAFGLVPFCMPQPVFLEAGNYELDAFEANSNWLFDPNSDKNMENCVEKISEAIERYLLPVFDICVDCGTALEELVKLEELFDYNRKEWLNQRGITDAAVPWQERSLFDSKKYYMALKAHDYVYARRYLEHLINSRQRLLKTFDDPGAIHQPAVVRERALNEMEEYVKQLQRIDLGDFGWFDELLKSNESQMLSYVTEKYPQILVTQ